MTAAARTGSARLLATAICGLAVALYAAAAAGFELTRLLGGGLPLLSGLTAAFWAGFCLLGLGLVWRGRRTALPPTDSDPAPATGGIGSALGLALLMALAAAWAVFVFRPDFDDSYYLANVTWAVTHPGLPITDEIRGIAAAPLEPFRSVHWAIAVGYDYLSASLGHLTGLPHLDIRYFWLPGLAGAVLVAGSFLLMTRLCAEDGHALLATLAVVILYVIWRETHRDPGNFAFPRFFQGKAVMMTALTPVFAAWLWGLLDRPTALAAAGLAGLALGAGGMTASTVLVFGGIGCGVVAAALAERPRATPAILLHAGIGALCCLPLVLPLLHVLGDPLPLGADSPANEGWPGTVMGHVKMMGKSTWALLLVLLGVVAVLGRGAARRAVLAWTVLVIALFLNPVTGQVLLDKAIGPNGFWRLFYILPWVPLAGLAALALLDRLPAVLAARRGFVLALALLLALPAMTVFDSLRGQPVPSGHLEWKLDRTARIQAEAVIAASPEGPMLAPLIVSRQIPVLDGHRPQLRLRTFGIRVWALHAGQPELADRRILATAALSGAATPGAETRNAAYLGGEDQAGPAAQLAALTAVIAESTPASVVFRPDAPLAAQIAEILTAAGYAPYGETADHAIWAPEAKTP